MYRKYKEQKDKEYESIIKKQVNESKLIAEQEGIAIPKTLDDYVAPSRAGALGTTIGKNGKKSLFSHEDDLDLGIDVRVSRRESTIDRVSSSSSRMMMIKWATWSMMTIDPTMTAIENGNVVVVLFLLLSFSVFVCVDVECQ
jgi:hypothetical protein